MIRATLQPFLRHGFDRLFPRYAPEWIELAVEMAEESRELIVADVQRKYPNLSGDHESATAFAEILDTDATIVGPVLHRLTHALFRRHPGHGALPYLAQFMRVQTGMEIYYSAVIGPGLRVMHGVGLVLGPRHRIGRDFTIYQGVTLGQRRNHSPEEFITVGDRCTFFAGAAALGTITVGDDVKLAANAVLLQDAEPGATYGGVPAKKISG